MMIKNKGASTKEKRKNRRLGKECVARLKAFNADLATPKPTKKQKQLRKKLLAAASKKGRGMNILSRGK